jgi:hypothetical protein
MPPAQTPGLSSARAAQVMQKTREVLDYHDNPARPGRPLYILLGGGGLAVLALVLAALLAYRAWYLKDVQETQAITGLSFLFCFYVLGIFLFSMGYELYDTARAVRLTLIVSVASFLAVMLIAGVVIALAQIRGSSRAINGLARAADSGNSNALLQSVISMTGGDDDKKDDNPGWFGFSVPPAPPVEPVDFLITCPSCHRKFTPMPPKAICPWCDKPALSA